MQQNKFVLSKKPVFCRFFISLHEGEEEWDLEKGLGLVKRTISKILWKTPFPKFEKNCKKYFTLNFKFRNYNIHFRESRNNTSNSGISQKIRKVGKPAIKLFWCQGCVQSEVLSGNYTQD